MLIRLHKNARTTPAVRQEIQDSDLGERALAKKHNISRATARKWKKRRDSTADGSHRPQALRATPSPAQEAVVVELRRTLLLPLDDLVAVTREFIHPDVSRSGLDRCLRRHGVSNLKALRPAPPEAPAKTLKDYEPGYVHIDIKYLPAIEGEPRRYLFVAIDRATRWVCLDLKPGQTAAPARAFLDALAKAAPFTIRRLPADNGKAFTDRFTGQGEREPTGRHAFDQGCAERGIEHRLIPPGRPQTNGMVERFNGRVADVLKTTRFDSTADLATTLRRYADLYNHAIPQRALGHVAPAQALAEWREKKPSLFASVVNNQPGLDIRLAPPEAGPNLSLSAVLRLPALSPADR
jgi:transposase InsO family protein